MTRGDLPHSLEQEQRTFRFSAGTQCGNCPEIRRNPAGAPRRGREAITNLWRLRCERTFST